MAIKLAIEGLNDKRIFEIDQSVITVGRSKSCHIELDHPEISRRHFMIKFMDHAYSIFDENSRHGTFLDGSRLEPFKRQPLSHEHSIEVPGFIIVWSWDGHEPRIERTTVVARQLLDELLQDEVSFAECPSLQATDGTYTFRFLNNKTSFVLGSLPEVDFFVKDDSVAKEHVSFVRDINGICLNPLPEHSVFINGQLITDPQIIIHDSVITVGNSSFIFKVRPEKSDEKTNAILSQGIPLLSPIPSAQYRVNKAMVQEENKYKIEKKPPSLLKFFDRIFFWSFILVLIGTVVIFFSLV